MTLASEPELKPVESTARGSDGLAVRRALFCLRVGIGVIWALNFLFIAWPANQFFPTFAATASSFGPTTLGGPSLANAAAANAPWLSYVVAGVTIYLAIAFIAGFTTRAACVVGLVFNGLLLITQYGQIVVVPGGTDVGPMPLYLLIYVVLLVGRANELWSVDAVWRARRLSRRQTVTVASSPAPDA